LTRTRQWAKRGGIGIKAVTSLLALLTVTGGLTACGVSGTIDPVASAATKTQQAGGARMSITLQVQAVTGRSYEITAHGEFDQQEADMTVDLSNLFQTAAANGSAAGVELRYLIENDDPVVYMGMPFLAGKLPGGKSWIRVDLEKAATGLGVDYNQLLGQSNQNPADVLGMLRATGQVTEVGPETVNGVATTDYKGTVDLAKALELHGIAADAAQKLIDTSGMSEVPVEVWVGDGGLVRRLQVTTYTRTDEQTFASVLTIDISDFGTVVSVSAPPSDQVYDATAVATAALPTTTH
jgi:hypothetical protein